MKKFSRHNNDNLNLQNEERIEQTMNYENKNEVIKKRQSPSRFAINLGVFITVLIMAFGILFSYPKIKEISSNQNKSVYDDYNILNQINDCNVIIYKNIVEKQNENEKTLEQIYINGFSDNSDHNFNSYDNETSYTTESGEESNQIRHYDYILKELSSTVYSVQNKMNYDLKNLDYAAVDKDGNILVSKGINEIEKSSSNESYNYDKLQEKYGFYVAVHYDNNGFAEIKDCYGIDLNTARHSFGYGNIDTEFLNDIDGVTVNYDKIQDTTIIYAIPKELKYDDMISNIVKIRSSGYVSQDIVMMFGFIVGCIVLLLGLIVPYRIEKEIAGFKNMMNIPFEINCVIYGVVSFMLMGMGLVGVSSTLNGEAVKVLEYLKISSTFDNTLIYLCNLLLWMIIIYFILSGMTILKYIFKYGFGKYLKERVLIVRGFRFVIRKSEDGLDYLSHIDLSDRSNKIIIKVLIINFIILSAISIIWFFGIFAAIVYNIILFVVIRKYYDKVRDNYSDLLNATNKIAEGKLDFEINEDLGIFNPFKDELKKIQSGFKKAVNEEVKSQRMKTELISNVSHDLKTPLTSIITYADLLKKENITDEERKSYIDTIDKKSQRLKFLIEDLFEVSKATSGNIKLNLVNVDIVELIRQIEIELSDKLDSAKLIVKNNFPESKIVLQLDSQKTFRIFENLLNNVAKYSMEGSRVYVDMIENTDSVEIVIKNMSAVEINYNADEIIERFQRGDKSRNTEGSGLGLAIAKSFVEAQNGNFKVELDGDLFKVMISFKK